jgi:alkaline phosphatase D
MRKVNRRLFIASSVAAVGGLAVPSIAGAAGSTAARRRAAADPFGLGVASGDPKPDGVVLWTRLAPKPLEIGGGMGDREVAVQWEVATDEAFGNVVAKGTETAVAGEGHSVHAEPTGLQAGAEYFYRFKADDVISPVGRTKTAPAPGSDPGSVKFAMASCQHFEEGYYPVHHFIAADDPDLVLFLGDYMYEKPSGLKPVRYYVESDEVDKLDEYRLRHAQTHMDPNLRAAHAVAPWLPVFDDHELANNWYGNGSDWPDTRKQSAFQAYWENMPLPKSMKPTGPAIPLYRTVSWGALARFHMMDTRQYRWKQAAKDNCGQIQDPDRTLTGADQEAWLLEQLGAGGSKWDLLGQQVFFAGRDGDGSTGTCDVSTDSWDGYQASRQRVTQGWIDRKVRNPIVLTGDVHRSWANSLRLDYFDHDSPLVGAEFVTTSVTSGGNPGSTDEPPGYVAHNPHLNYVGNIRGYVRVTADNSQMVAEFMKVSTVTEPDANKVTLSVDETYTVLDGQPGLQP